MQRDKLLKLLADVREALLADRPNGDKVLEDWLEQCISNPECVLGLARDVAEEVKQLQAQCAILNEALEPFAKVQIREGAPDHLQFYAADQIDNNPLTIGDMRRAEAALFCADAGQKTLERVRNLVKAAKNVIKHRGYEEYMELNDAVAALDGDDHE